MQKALLNVCAFGWVSLQFVQRFELVSDSHLVSPTCRSVCGQTELSQLQVFTWTVATGNASGGPERRTDFC